MQFQLLTEIDLQNMKSEPLKWWFYFRHYCLSTPGFNKNLPLFEVHYEVFPSLLCLCIRVGCDYLLLTSRLPFSITTTHAVRQPGYKTMIKVRFAVS